MPAPSRRTKSQKMKKLRTPGAKLIIHYTRRKKSAKSCAECKKELKAVPKSKKSQINKLSKSKKRPNRPYAGNLCAGCLKNRIEESLYTNS